MSKPNDFLAANLNAPENFTLSDFNLYGLTPDNTDLKKKEDYLNIKQVKDTFTDKNGVFDAARFDAFYDSVSRMYNDWSRTDFAKNIMLSIPRSREDISDINNANVRNTNVELFSLNDPWRHQRGMGNIYAVGKESFDVREVAQANKVHDAEGNELDYTANDIGFFRNPFKSLFGKALVLAEDEKGQLLLNKNGDPYYRELKDGESTYGKESLHITDTLTDDDSWINKFDFFDNDGLDKSVIGTLANTAARVAPYLIPYVGPIFGAIDAAKGLATAMPALAKAVNGIITNESDNTSFGKAMNTIEGYMQRFQTSKSRNAKEHNWSFEGIGDMVATSAAQLFQQKTFTYIPALLGMKDLDKASKLGQTLSLGFMAATSAEDSLQTFKEAGVDDRTAGVMMLAYTAALYGFMNQDYFKEQLFKNTWLTADPEVRMILRQNNKEAARIALASIENAAKPGAVKKFAEEEVKKESANIFKQVWNATKTAWKNKSWSPFKGLDIVAPGSVYNTGNIYLNRAFNEGVEEVMEETLLDVGKVITLGLNALGFDIKDETREKIDYGLTIEDALQRYLTAFVGGAIGGAVFEGLDRYNTHVLNKDVSDYAGRGLNGELIRAIRNHGVDRVLSELETLKNAGKLGDRNLGVHGHYVTDPQNKENKIFVFEAGSESNNQNNLMYNIMKTRIKALDSTMKDLGIYQNDNEIMNNIVSEIEESAKEAGMSKEEYMRKNKRDVFSEFVQKTGFADIILSDIGNLEIDALEYNAKIEDERAKIIAKYSDTERAKAEDEISKSKIIKEWTKKRDEVLKQREDIISGKDNGKYIKYASFAAHNSYVSKFFGKEGDDFDVADYAWAKYHITYDALSENAKKAILDDFTTYQKSNGVKALYEANELFQNVNNIIAPYIEQTNDKYKGFNYNPNLSEEVVGQNEANSDLIDPRVILNRKYNKNGFQSIVDELLDSTRVNPDKITRLLHSIKNYYDYVNNNKIIAEYGDDWVGYAFSRLKDALIDDFSTENLDNSFKSALENAQFKANEMLDEDVEGFDDAINYNTQYNIVEPLYGNADARARYTNRLKEIIPNLISDPDEALNQLEDLKENLRIAIKQDEVKENVIETLTSEFENIAKRIKAIKESQAKMVHSPVIEMAQAISYEVNGTEIPILDQIAKEKDSLISKDTTSEYILTSDLARKQLESAKRIIPMLEVALHAAFNTNRWTNEFLNDSEKLPEIDSGLYNLYVDDFHFLKNKINYLLYLNDLNKNAKVREQILVRKNFYRNVINRLLNNQTIDGEDNPQIEKLSKSMKDIDFAELWDKAGGTNLDLESDDKEMQLKVMIAFSNFEHLIREHIRTNVSDYAELGKDIALSFGDTYKMKNGILSSNSNDNISNFDLMTYLLCVAGTDSYEFGRKIKHRFETEGEKFPFYGQELAIRFAYLGIQNKNLVNGAIAGIEESIDEAINQKVIIDADNNGRKLDTIAKSSELYLKDKSNLWNTIIIDGFAGVGKSTVIAKIALEIAKDVEVIAVSKDGERAKALGSQFSSDVDHIKTLTQLLSDGLGKAYLDSEWIEKFRGHDAKLKSTEKPESGEDDKIEYKPIETNFSFKKLQKDDSKQLVIVIDECTQLSEGQWQILVDAAKREDVTIIGLGNTMQTGAAVESDNTLNSVNLDDCNYLSTSKLTISMRTANAGKNENNIKVGNIAKIATDLQKDNPTYPISVLSKDPLLNEGVKLDYNNIDGRVSGDMIVSDINDKTIDDTVSALKENETLVIVTPNDNDFVASREKYGSLTTSDGKPKVVFTKEELVGGAEYDFAIINVGFTNNPNVKLLDIKRFYTLTTRAKQGSIIKNSTGLSESLKIISAISPTASAETSFEPNSDVAVQYKESRLNALNAIPAPSEPEENPEEAPSGGEDKSGEPSPVDLTTDEDGKEKITVEDVISEVESESENKSVEDIPTEDSNDDLTDSWLSSDTFKGRKAQQYLKRKSLLNSKQTNLVDADIFADWLVDAKVENLAYCPLTSTNPNAIEEYKKLIKVLSSIFYTETSENRHKIFPDRNPIDNQYYKTSFSNSLEDALSNNRGVFFLQKMEEDPERMLVYYCFGDKFAIPVTIISLGQNTNNSIEGFYKNIQFKQQTGIIPISSRGKRRAKISETLGNFVEVVTSEENPITAIFTLQEDKTPVTNNRRNKYFMKNKGKAFVGLTIKSGLTGDESRKLWNPIVKNGIIEYFLQDTGGDDSTFSIAGVQEDIDAKTFFDIVGAVKKLSYGNVDSDANDKAIQMIADFFHLDVSEVKNDFKQLYYNDPNISAKENAKRFGAIRSKYNILYQREIELMTSAILQYCIENNSDDNHYLEYLTENLYNTLGVKYTNGTNGEIVRIGGLRITVYDNKRNPRRFEIIPTPDFKEFAIYESEFGGVRVNGEGNLGTIKHDDFITNNRVDYKKLINSAWNIIYSTSDISRQTNYSDELKTNDISSKINDLIKNGTLSLSLTTESNSDEDGTIVKYFSPFESKLLELISYPKSTRKEGQFIDNNTFMDMLKRSTLFTYGIYRQILIGGDIGDNPIWKTGNVSFDHLTWDVVKVLAPVFSVEKLENITSDNDKLHSIREYGKEIFNNLLTASTNDPNSIIITQVGDRIQIYPGLLVDASDIRWSKVFSDDEINDFVGARASLKEFIIKNGKIGASFSNGQIRVITEEQYKILLDGISDEIPDIHSVENNKIIANFGNISFVGSDITPKIKVGENQAEPIKKIELAEVDGNSILYIYSEKLGLTTVNVSNFPDDNKSGIQSIWNDLVQKNNKYGNYLGFTESDGFSYYYKEGPIINTLDSDGIEDKLYIKGITDHSILTVDNNGLTIEIPFTNLVNVQSIKNKFNVELLKSVEGAPKLAKAYNSLQVINGRFEMSGIFASEISNFAENINSVVFGGIDFDTNKIMLNGTEYDLNPVITEQVIDNWFGNYYVNTNVKIAKRVRDAFKQVSSKLSDFEIFIQTLTNDDLENRLNDYLLSHARALNGIWKVNVSRSGEVRLSQDISVNAAIKLAILKEMPSIDITTIKNIKVNKILSSPDFSVTLQNDSEINGKAEKINNEWKITFNTLASDITFDYLLNKLNEYEINNELTSEDIEYFKYSLSLSQGKTKINPEYVMYCARNLIPRTKANPESIEAKFLLELSDYNKKCKI